MTKHPAGEQQASRRLDQALVELSAVQLELDRERLRRAEIEALFDEVLDAMTDAVVVTDPAGRVRRQNRAATTSLGPDPTDVRVVAGGADMEAMFETAWEILRHSPSGSHTREVVVATSRTPALPLSVSSNVIRDPHGKVVGAVFAARDLSETQRLLVAVREVEVRWKVLALVNGVLASSFDLRTVLSGVCAELDLALGVRSMVLVVDDWGVRTYGASTDSAGEVRIVPTRSALHTVIAEGRIIDVSQTAGYPVGIDLPEGSALLAPLRANGEVVGALLLHRDSTGGFPEQVAELAQEVASRIGGAIANVRLRTSLTHAEAFREATEFRQHIAAALSHEMKTPLASIIGAIQALRHAPMDPKRAEQMHELLHRQAQRMNRLVGQLLDFARLEAGHPLAMTSESTNVADVIASVVDGHPGRLFECSVVPQLPALWCDSDRLAQIIANLVSNAAKYAPPALPIVITAELSDDARLIVVTVRDHGPGIDPTDQARLFEQFRRGVQAGTEEGTGLGLYLTKALVDAHGGTIRCDSRFGHGATFTVSLPVDRPNVAGVVTREEPANVRG